jgi:hypothetical protein
MENVLTAARTAPPAKTWEELYCGRHGGTREQVRRAIFWRALHLHALPFAPVLLWSRFFAADFDLIGGCMCARSMRELREEIDSNRHHPERRGWLRRRAGFRLSTQRLRRLAGDYLPGSKLPPPFRRD